MKVKYDYNKKVIDDNCDKGNKLSNILKNLNIAMFYLITKIQKALTHFGKALSRL